MREFWKRTAIRAAIGFVPGVLVGLIFLSFYGIGAYCADYGAGRLALNLVVSGLLGAVNMGSAAIYSLEHWGVLRCTLTHFVIAMTSYCAVGFALGWIDPREPATLWMLAACIVAYFIIWLIMYLISRRKVRRINESLKRWKDAQGGD